MTQNQNTWRKASVLYASTLLGVLTGMLVSILNTRSLSPAEYGDVRYVANFPSLFSGLLLLGYFTSGSRLLALAKDERHLHRLRGVLLIVLAVMAAVLMALMAVTGWVHTSLLQRDCGLLFFAAIPVAAAPLMLNYLNTAAQGSGRLYSLAAARLLPGLLYLAVAMPFYSYCGATSTRMLLLQQGTASIVLLALILMGKPSMRGMREEWQRLRKENRQYGMHVYIGSLAGISVQYVAGVTLGLLGKDNTEVGLYTLAVTISMPLVMLPQVVGTSYFRQFANIDRMPRKVLRITLWLTGASLAAFLLLIHPVVDFLYPADYAPVARYASWLALGCVIHGMGDVVNRFLGAHGQGKALRNGAFISGGVALVGYTAGVALAGINGAIATRILSSMAYCLAMAYAYRRYQHVKENM